MTAFHACVTVSNFKWLPLNKAFGANVSSLTAYGPLGNDEQFPLRSEGRWNTIANNCITFSLRWGEVIPLYFMQSQRSRVVILSQPSRRYNSDVAMIPELLQLGRTLQACACLIIM